MDSIPVLNNDNCWFDTLMEIKNVSIAYEAENFL